MMTHYGRNILFIVGWEHLSCKKSIIMDIAKQLTAKELILKKKYMAKYAYNGRCSNCFVEQMCDP